MILIRRPWTRQPPYPARADVSAGASFLWSASGGLTADALGNSLTPTTVALSRVYENIVAAQTTGGGKLQYAAGVGDFGTGDFTAVMVATPAAGTDVQVLLGRITGGTGNSMWIGVSGTAWSCGGAVTAAAGSRSTTRPTVVYVRKSGVGQFYINGALSGSSAADTANVNATTGWAILNFGSYTTSTTYDWIGSAAMAAMLPYAEPEIMALSLSRNPWQLFDRQRIPIPMSVAASGIPTLTALTASNITTSGWRATLTAA